jgi:hypothetical protein
VTVTRRCLGRMAAQPSLPMAASSARARASRRAGAGRLGAIWRESEASAERSADSAGPWLKSRGLMQHRRSLSASSSWWWWLGAGPDSPFLSSSPPFACCSRAM